MLNVECRHCKENTEKRIVVKCKPLKKLDTILPNGYEELYCSNSIKTRRVWFTHIDGKKEYKWIEEECRNHILVRKKIKEVSS